MSIRTKLERIFDQIALAGGPAIQAEPLAQALRAPLDRVTATLAELERDQVIYQVNPHAPSPAYAGKMPNGAGKAR